jgi:hypothetical protein
MPAQSKSQQRLFGMALAQKRGKMKGASKKVKELAKSMSASDLEDFASTKHKDIQEGFVLKFNEFINEAQDELGSAYINPEGELKGLEFTPEEEFEINTHQDVENLMSFFDEVGAKNLEYKRKDGILGFKFEYMDRPLLILIDLDNSRSALVDRTTDQPIFQGTAESLLDLIGAKGFDFVLYGQ